MSTLATDALARVAVVGTSGSGKSTFARQLAQIRGTTHIELDALHWGPNWTPAPKQRFRSAVDEATRQPKWICDGNYQPVCDLVWGRATTVIWLNYSLPVVFSRALRRSIARCMDGQPLFAGNRETFQLTFFNRQSVLLWVLQTYGQYRREYRRLLAGSQFAHLQRVEFATPKQAEKWLLEKRAGDSLSTSNMPNIAEVPGRLLD